MLHVGTQVVEQDVAQATTQDGTEHAVKQQIAETGFVHTREAASPNAPAPEEPARREREQVHHPVPVDLHRAELECNRVDLVQEDHVREDHAGDGLGGEKMSHRSIGACDARR
jgi:hypothetical protein